MTPTHLLPSAHTRTAATLAEIERTVAAAFALTVDEMRRPTRALRISWPRQVAMWLMSRLTLAGPSAIGRRYGMDHTTVLYAAEIVEGRMASYPELKAELEALRAKVEGL